MSLGVLFPHGVILYGPSGVGKSLLAASLAGETPAHHTHLSTAQLLSQDSEGLLNKTFSDARNKLNAHSYHRMIINRVVVL